MKKFCMSYSGGKDSTLALYEMIQEGNIPVAIIMNVNSSVERSWFHGIDEYFMNELAASLGIELICAYSSGNDYRKSFLEAIEVAKSFGATECVFGDIDIDDHRIWCEKICIEADIKCNHPLWGRSRSDIVNKFVECGFKSVITTISKEFDIPKYFLGMVFDSETISLLKLLDIDECGENGEFHTYTFDGPIFKYPIQYELGELYENEYVYTKPLLPRD